jgi:hypothetical protein
MLTGRLIRPSAAKVSPVRARLREAGSHPLRDSTRQSLDANALRLREGVCDGREGFGCPQLDGGLPIPPKSSNLPKCALVFVMAIYDVRPGPLFACLNRSVGHHVSLPDHLLALQLRLFLV